MKNKKIKFIAITGPTASGKSALAVRLAHILNGEIVSCDSMQIYRGMDIGTAKPDKSEMEGIPHHMIDVADPYDLCGYNCARYCEEAGRIIREVSSRGKLPIVCGGTGMYLDALIRGTEFGDAPSDPDIREKLNGLTSEELYARLLEVDPEAAASIHPNNVKRVARSVEIYEISGMTKSEWDRKSHSSESPYDCRAIALDILDRSVLYERIRRRVDCMIENGLVDEAASLKLLPGTTAAEAIGYKEIYSYLRGEVSLEDAVNRIKLNTQHYAKRQQTWLRHRNYLNWVIACDKYDTNKNNLKNIVNISLTLLKNEINMI